ncbi:MAG: ABC transporter permease [Gammaproteobacteria bacterium]|jgi:putative ABC transport system permease protein
MDIRPIFNAMLRNRTGAVLIALQIALTLAIVCNAMFIISARVERMSRPLGYDVGNTFIVTMRAYAPDYNPAIAERLNLDLLRRLPGVRDAASINEVPVSGGGWSDSLRTTPDPAQHGVEVGLYHVDSHGLSALGLQVSEGRAFTPDDIVRVANDHYTAPPVGILSRAAADKLFPDQSALGKVVYDAGKPITIIGIVDRMEASWPHWEGFERTMLLPTVLEGPYMQYVVRTRPGERDRVMAAAEERLGSVHTGNFVRRIRSLEAYRDHIYGDDRAMAVVLLVVIALILAITALGIVALASFSVSQRTRQIGTRRALGARRRDIVSYFMTENSLITLFGVVLGSALAVGLNYWLVDLYSLPPIAWYYLPLGILCLWGLGLLAVLGPALRAAAISPAIATRNV